MKRTIYISQDPLHPALETLFSGLGENYTVTVVDDTTLKIVDTDYYNPEPFDIEAFRELILEDMNQDVTLTITPYHNKPFPLEQLFYTISKELSYGVYYFDDIIVYAVLLQQQNLKQRIKQFFEDVVNDDVIHTVRNFIEYNMNSSEAAKHLYMHRNTLNYRIDQFIDRTYINVKTFKGANAIYMLYKY